MHAGRLRVVDVHAVEAEVAPAVSGIAAVSTSGKVTKRPPSRASSWRIGSAVEVGGSVDLLPAPGRAPPLRARARRARAGDRAARAPTGRRAGVGGFSARGTPRAPRPRSRAGGPAPTRCGARRGQHVHGEREAASPSRCSNSSAGPSSSRPRAGDLGDLVLAGRPRASTTLAGRRRRSQRVEELRRGCGRACYSRSSSRQPPGTLDAEQAQELVGGSARTSSSSVFGLRVPGRRQREDDRALARQLVQRSRARSSTAASRARTRTSAHALLERHRGGAGDERVGDAGRDLGQRSRRCTAG